MYCNVPFAVPSTVIKVRDVNPLLLGSITAQTFTGPPDSTTLRGCSRNLTGTVGVSVQI